MPLADFDLLELLWKLGIRDVTEISRLTPELNKRSSISRLEIGRSRHADLRLLEKCTEAEKLPIVNQAYKLYTDCGGPVPAVLYNEYDTNRKEGVLLVENMSSTHRDLREWEAPVMSARLCHLIEMIATFHSLAWNREDRAAFLPKHLKSKEAYIRHLSFLERDYHHFRKHQTYNLQEKGFQCYENSLVSLRENAGDHMERIAAGRNTTLIHGDMHVGNILYPVDTDSNAKPVLVDLEAVRVGLCTEDLMMVFVQRLWKASFSR